MQIEEAINGHTQDHRDTLLKPALRPAHNATSPPGLH